VTPFVARSALDLSRLRLVLFLGEDDLSFRPFFFLFPSPFFSAEFF